MDRQLNDFLARIAWAKFEKARRAHRQRLVLRPVSVGLPARPASPVGASCS